jgi:uncharacterized protein
MNPSVGALYRYPVKSFQGEPVDRVEVGRDGIVGDRRFGLLDDAGRLLSAKRTSALLQASAHTNADGSVSVDLPGLGSFAADDPALVGALTSWLDRPVTVREPVPDEQVSYEMTFDPPDDAADAFEIPAPLGLFQDLAAIHLVTTATLGGCTTARPDLTWDVRRFRPNIVLECDGEAFLEDAWCGRQITIGSTVLMARQPTVRCAMPLRAQPASGERPALERQPGIFTALNELNQANPNHLGLYLDVVEPGVVRVGDPVTID